MQMALPKRDANNNLVLDLGASCIVEVFVNLEELTIEIRISGQIQRMGF